jgi:hypothetical protein
MPKAALSPSSSASWGVMSAFCASSRPTKNPAMPTATSSNGASDSMV